MRFTALPLPSRGPSRKSAYSGFCGVDTWTSSGGATMPGAASVDSDMIQFRALNNVLPLASRMGRPSPDSATCAPAAKARMISRTSFRERCSRIGGVPVTVVQSVGRMPVPAFALLRHARYCDCICANVRLAMPSWLSSEPAG